MSERPCTIIIGQNGAPECPGVPKCDLLKLPLIHIVIIALVIGSLGCLQLRNHYSMPRSLLHKAICQVECAEVNISSKRHIRWALKDFKCSITKFVARLVGS